MPTKPGDPAIAKARGCIVWTAQRADTRASTQIGGISTAELHELELFAVQQLKYRLCISPDEVATRLRELKVLAHSRAALPVEASAPLSAPPPVACMAAETSRQT